MTRRRAYRNIVSHNYKSRIGEPSGGQIDAAVFAELAHRANQYLQHRSPSAESRYVNLSGESAIEYFQARAAASFVLYFAPVNEAPLFSFVLRSLGGENRATKRNIRTRLLARFRLPSSWKTRSPTSRGFSARLRLPNRASRKTFATKFLQITREREGANDRGRIMD